MSNDPSTIRKLRTPAFYAAIVLYVAAYLALPTREVMTHLYAAGQVGLQLGVADSHAADGHYALIATASVLIVATGLLASGAGNGWRLPAWGTGGLAVVLGLSSVAFPLHASSVGATWGVLAIGWGVAFVASAEGTTLDTAPTLLRRRVGGTS